MTARDPFLTRRTARWLSQMVLWMDEAEEYVALGEERFLTDRSVRVTIAHALGGVGEQAHHLVGAGVENHAAYGTLPWEWHEMAGLRNRVSHYNPVDAGIVWGIASRLLPDTRDVLAPLLDEAEEYVVENGVAVLPLETNVAPLEFPAPLGGGVGRTGPSTVRTADRRPAPPVPPRPEPPGPSPGAVTTTTRSSLAWASKADEPR